MPGPDTRTICIMGLGYIGLPTAAVLASRGHRVHGVDPKATVVDSINEGRAHFSEPDLDMLVSGSVGSGRLTAHREAMAADVFIVCVPTPLTTSREPDLSFVDAAADAIAPHVRPGNLVVLESTSPPGTTARIADRIAAATGHGRDAVHYLHAPERVLPGKILREVVENDRIIGGLTDAATAAGAAFYRGFVTGELLLTTSRTAESVKLIENAYRDVNIAFANELSVFADATDLDVWELIRLANHHPRVEILRPGPGVGGHCIAVDPWFLVHVAPDQTPLIRAARAVNEAKPEHVVQRVIQRAQRFKQPRIACLGLTYKPDVDDLRESPAVQIVRRLHEEFGVAQLSVVEPNLTQHPDFELAPLEEAVASADIVLVLVAHRQFAQLPRTRLAEKAIIDTCGGLTRVRS